MQNEPKDWKMKPLKELSALIPLEEDAQDPDGEMYEYGLEDLLHETEPCS